MRLSRARNPPSVRPRSARPRPGDAFACFRLGPVGERRRWGAGVARATAGGVGSEGGRSPVRSDKPSFLPS